MGRGMAGSVEEAEAVPSAVSAVAASAGVVGERMDRAVVPAMLKSAASGGGVVSTAAQAFFLPFSVAAGG